MTQSPYLELTIINILCSLSSILGPMNMHYF